ncbi:hypothetical protein K493DRAFT_346140 [Basidiobolus meristosporus CBS 931.73]|uniref:histidine kinase n=1 Tax=Basidiobolus meristosporus CBS 931.73 TaxID=1314790 RepID=A0A1Y1YZF7_9FUNG|nr:hypothetical protein K493DRAFT_346140 [Basidiobolus meristosporus CBS 931.73]|eukprot:ORY03430.1 hypothetical protein K493DRAFT_346140 [Basidiobolus meristosporus CBS 931.73]
METLDIREETKQFSDPVRSCLRSLRRWILYHPRSPEVDAEVAMKYLLIKTFSLMLLLAMVVWWLQFGLTHQTRYLTTVPVLCATIPLILHHTQSTTLAGSLLIVCLMSVSAVTIQMEGGFSVLGAASSHVFPLLAVMTVGRTAGIFVTMVCILENGYFYWNRSLAPQAIPSVASERQALIVLVGYSVNLLFICTLSILHDFSRTLCTDELVDVCKQALDASRAKSRFVSQVSHELRTPLSAIFGWTELLLTDPKIGDEPRANMKMVHAASRNLLAILNDILDVSKLGADKMVLCKGDFDLHELAVDTCHIMSGLSSKKGLELLLDYPRGMPCLFQGDSGRIRQMLSNLVSNAVKFTEKGYIEVSFKVQSEDVDEARILCLVKDTGIGIPHEVQNKLFKEFSQVKGSNASSLGYSTRVQTGTGLGLFLVKRLTELMNGEVLIQSEPGKGSVFGFSIPLEKQRYQEANDDSHINPLPTTTHFLSAFLSNPSPLYDTENVCSLGSLRLHDRTFLVYSRSQYFESFLFKLVHDSWGVSACHLMVEQQSSDSGERYITVPGQEESLCDSGSVLLFDLSPGQKHRPSAANDEASASPKMEMDVEEWLDIICRSLTRNQHGYPSDEWGSAELNDQAKPTLIFFYAFGQASKVQIPTFVNRYYNVSICRKPVSERELIALLCDPYQGEQKWDALSRSIHSKHLPERRLSASKLKLPNSILGGQITTPPKEFFSGDMSPFSEDPPSDTPLPTPEREKRVSISDTVEYIKSKPPSRASSPSRKARSPRKTTNPSSSEEQPPSDNHSRVLVVDDNAINRKLALSQLKKLGVNHVDLAADGMVACEKHKENRYDLILMDLQMPRMDGYEATRVIRQMESEWTEKPPQPTPGEENALAQAEREDSGVSLTDTILAKPSYIIALTADQSLDTTEGRQAALDHGMNDVAVKPISLSALSGMLDKWLPKVPSPNATTTT